MTSIPRRNFLIGAGSALALATACDNSTDSQGADKIDARVNTALSFLHTRYPDTLQLSGKAAGILVMPLVTKMGVIAGGEYGRGALRIGGVTVDYYLLVSGSLGLQLGAQQSSHVLFFMTDDALRDFRQSPGWAVGADADYALNNNGGNLSAATTTAQSPVVALIFGQAGLAAGATLKGTKYTRIIP